VYLCRLVSGRLRLVGTGNYTDWGDMPHLKMPPVLTMPLYY